MLKVFEVLTSDARSLRLFAFISAALLLLGFALLNTGEPVNKSNPLFRPSITLLYAGFGVFLLSLYLRLLSRAPKTISATPQNLKHHIASYLSATYPFFLALLGIILMGVISLYFTADKPTTWNFLRRYLLEPSLFLLLVSLYFYMLKPSLERVFFYVFVGIIALHPVLTIADFCSHSMESWRMEGGGLATFLAMFGSYRPAPFFFSEAQTGHGFFLIISLGFALAGYCATRKTSLALLAWVNVLACLLSNTRLVYIALFVMLLAPLVMLPYRHKRRLLLITGGASVFCLALFYHISMELSPRYNVRFMLENFSKVISLPPAAMGRFDSICDDMQKCMPQSYPRDPEISWEHSSLNRLSMAKATWLGILDNPLRPNGFGLWLFAKNIVQIFGQGSENIPYYIDHKDNGTIQLHYWTNHHGLLYLWFELGAIGFGFILWLHGWILLKARRLYYASTSSTTKAIALGLAISILGLIVANCFDALPNRAGTLILFMIFGVFLALCAKVRSASQQGA